MNVNADRLAAVVESMQRAIATVANYFDPDDLAELVVRMAREPYGYTDEEDEDSE